MKPPQTISFDNYSLIDLTHPLNSQMPTWGGSCGFQHSIKCDHDECTTTPKFRTFTVEMKAGVGTHMDAPIHCFSDGISIAEIPLKELVAPLFVLDVSAKADFKYQISAQDILDFEEVHGIIPSHSLVVGYTGWSRYWNTPEKYRNADELGQLHFPSMSKDAAQLLLKRGIAGIGVDTLSPDIGMDGLYPVHEIFLGSGKYIIENIANAHLLPPKGALAIAAPLKIENGTEAPIRLIAIK